MKSKFETKNPLVNQHLVLVHIEYYFRSRENRCINLFKKGIGSPALTAKGTRLPHWYFSTACTARLKRQLKGIKRITQNVVNVSVEEYYNILMSDLEKVLEQDMYWYDLSAPFVKKLWERVSELLNEIVEEEVEVDVPELVTYFYNCNIPKIVTLSKKLIEGETE